MGIILKTKKHFWTRLPLGGLLILFFGISPFIVGIIGAYIHELITNEQCLESNCVWGVIPWIGIFTTLPLAAIFLVVYAIVILIDTFRV